MVSYPEILEFSLPTYVMLQELATPAFFWIYVAVLMCMIVSTIAGLLHGLNERLEAWHLDSFGKPAPPAARAATSLSVMLLSLLLSGLGITTLVAEGYGTMAWGYLVVFVLPLLVLAPRLIPAPSQCGGKR